MPAAYSQPGERQPGVQPSRLHRVSRDSNRVGFIDNTGKLVIGFDRLPRTTVGVADFHEGRAKIWLKRAEGAEDILTGYIDETGKVIIAPRFWTARDFSEGLAYVEAKGLRGFINRQGKLVIRIDNLGVGDLSATDFHEGMAAAKTKGDNPEWGYIDRSGRLAIKPQYRFVDDFSEGLAGVVVDGKYGFINKQGEMVIPPHFEPRLGPYVWDGIAGTSRFSEGVACVKLGKFYGYINKKGDFVIPPQLLSAQDFSEGVAWVIARDKKIGWIDKSGRWVITAVNGQSFSDTQSGLAYTARVTTHTMAFSEGLAPFIVIFDRGSYSRWGYMDHKGREVIKPRFAYIHPFDGGLAWVTDDEVYGYIDKRGQFVWQK